MSNQFTTSTNNENKNDLNKDKILKEFSSKFISTISALSDDYKNGGSKKGWLLSEAIKQFDKDWCHNYSYYMEKLECKNSLELAEKLGSRVRVFWDRYNGSRRVAVIKTLKNSSFLNQIDCDIEKRNRPHRCPVNIETKNEPKIIKDSKNNNFGNKINNKNTIFYNSSGFPRKVNLKKRVRFAVVPCTEDISILCERMKRLTITKELMNFYGDNNIEE
uniref:Uncharacterized protein n=1 Tax=Meloidogyne enterolobii TaxID=390850 RepID=A0A6V7VZR0_MELEN|nr:unnamed protein product [Meloidogyne enterolobii]